MKYQIIGKNIKVTDGIKSAIESKLSKLNKYFKNHDDLTCRALVRSYNEGAKIEVTIFADDAILRAEVRHEDLYAAIDLVVDKLESQIRKVKTKIKNKEHTELIVEEYEEPEEEVRVKEIPPVRLTLDEAIVKMESLGHSFFLYLDEEDDRPSVVYKRLDGSYGLLELEKEN